MHKKKRFGIHKQGILREMTESPDNTRRRRVGSARCRQGPVAAGAGAGAGAARAAWFDGPAPLPEGLPTFEVADGLLGQAGDR